MMFLYDLFFILTLKVLEKKIFKFANSADSDEAAHIQLFAL